MVTKRNAAVRVALGVLLLLSSAVLLNAGPAQAADNGRWAAFPEKGEGNTTTPRQYFIVNSAPGQTVKDTAVLTNFTCEPR